MKCLIQDENLEAVWKEVTDSVGRQHIDEESNKKKKIRQSTPMSTPTATLTVAIEQPVTTEEPSSMGRQGTVVNL